MFNKSEFKAQVARSEKTYKEIAENLGIDESTLWRKIQNDGSFTRKEINKLIIILNIESPETIFFAEELA